MATERDGVLMCDACGYGEIGPDITGRPMCYGCGPAEMSPYCPQCGHRLGHHTRAGCAMDCPCQGGSGGNLGRVGKLALGMERLDREARTRQGERG